MSDVKQSELWIGGEHVRATARFRPGAALQVDRCRDRLVAHRLRHEADRAGDDDQRTVAHESARAMSIIEASLDANRADPPLMLRP